MDFTERQLFHGFAAFTVDRTMRKGVGPDKAIQEWAALPFEEQKIWIAIAISARFGYSLDEAERQPDDDEIFEVLGWVTDAWTRGQPS